MWHATSSNASPRKEAMKERKPKGMPIKGEKPRGGIEMGPSHPYMVGLPCPPKSIEKQND
jgi:hypothetical protein